VSPGSRLLRRLEFRWITAWDFGSRRVLAVLQRPDVGDDRPAIARINLHAIVGHRAEPVRDDVEEVADVRLAQPVDVVRGRLTLEAALNDHAVAAASPVVTRAAIDVVSLLAPIEDLLVDGERELLDRCLVDLAGEEGLVVGERPARNRSLDQRACARAVGEKGALTLYGKPERPEFNWQRT